MKTKLKAYFFAAAIIGLCLALNVAFAESRQRKFIYDSKGKRDPLISLLDKESPTGLRTVFTPPEIEAKLPVEIAIKGILWNGREYFAIINDEVMKKGGQLGQVKIKEIEKDRVILEYGDREFTVFLRKEKEK